MIVTSLSCLKVIREKIRILHEAAYKEAQTNGLIWDSNDCKLCKCRHYDELKGCMQDDCVHNESSWTDNKVPCFDYSSDIIPNITKTPLDSKNNVKSLIRIEYRTNKKEVHMESIPIQNETEFCYELKGGDFVYKKNGERRGSTNKIYGRIKTRFFPPELYDKLEDCSVCGHSIYFPFEVISIKENNITYKYKVCPHCGNKELVQSGSIV